MLSIITIFERKNFKFCTNHFEMTLRMSLSVVLRKCSCVRVSEMRYDVFVWVPLRLLQSTTQRIHRRHGIGVKGKKQAEEERITLLKLDREEER